MRPTPAARIAILAALAFWTGIAMIPLPRPEPLPASADPREFSAMRALDRVRAIAQKPHPLGSAEQRRVRDYLLAELTKLGVSPQIETGFASVTEGRLHVEGNVENVIARLPGTDNTRPVMLAAHYDSVPRGPGAGDDASGVAVLLETLRALRSGPPLRNDAIFLITDGEERGLLGAQVFMRDHPWRSEPGVALNFEARGTSGNAFMFETSAGNEWLIRDLQAAVPQADATSVAYEIYRMMPNNTDLTIFKLGGLQGMNFAFIGNGDQYHTPKDNVAHLDLRSLQEQGRYALGMVRRFGSEDLRAKSSGDAVYFPTAFTSLIVYPGSWVVPIALVESAGLLVVAVAAWRRRARGAWIGVPLAILALVQFPLALNAPGAAYLIAWPLFGGIVAYRLLTAATGSIGPSRGIGWRVALMLVCPAPAFVLVLPLLSDLLDALGWRRGASLLAVAALLTAVCVLPQLALAVRGTNASATRKRAASA